MFTKAYYLFKLWTFLQKQSSKKRKKFIKAYYLFTMWTFWFQNDQKLMLEELNVHKSLLFV